MADPALSDLPDAQWRWAFPIPASKQTIDAGAIAEWLQTHGLSDATVAVDEVARVAYVNSADDPTAALAAFDGQPRAEERQLRQARQRLRDAVTKVNAGTALTVQERDRAIRDLAVIALRLVADGG